MKGSRAKKAAEGDTKEPLSPTAPSAPREGGPRPGPLVQASDSGVQIPASEFKKLIGQLRTSELLGAAAAEAFEAAAGLRGSPSPQSKGAKELRSEVAESREEGEKKPKKAMNFDAAPVDEIPDLPEESNTKKRCSVTDSDAAGHDAEEMENHCQKDAPEPPELNLTPKQNHMRTDLEMWVMDEIPTTFGVDDSEELAENLQEDGQADQITFLIAEKKEGEQDNMLSKWLADCPDADLKAAFTAELLTKVRAIQALGKKKKKKKDA